MVSEKHEKWKVPYLVGPISSLSSITFLHIWRINEAEGLRAWLVGGQQRVGKRWLTYQADRTFRPRVAVPAPDLLVLIQERFNWNAVASFADFRSQSPRCFCHVLAMNSAAVLPRYPDFYIDSCIRVNHYTVSWTHVHETRIGLCGRIWCT